MKSFLIHGRKVTGGVAEGEALVSKQAVSFTGGLDPSTGTLVEKGHDLMNRNIKDKVLVFPRGKGSSYFSHVAQLCRLAGNNPKAMVVKDIDPRTALAAVVMHIPVVSDLERDPTELIATGDRVKVDGDNGLIEITKRS